MNGPPESTLDDEDFRQLWEQSERQQQWLASDPAYLEWLESMDQGERDES